MTCPRPHSLDCAWDLNPGSLTVESVFKYCSGKSWSYIDSLLTDEETEALSGIPGPQSK